MFLNVHSLYLNLLFFRRDRERKGKEKKEFSIKYTNIAKCAIKAKISGKHHLFLYRKLWKIYLLLILIGICNNKIT